MGIQAKLFEDLQENKAIAARHKQAVADREVARWLMRAFDDERDEIVDLMQYDNMTLYEAIKFCMENPRDEDCW